MGDRGIYKKFRVSRVDRKDRPGQKHHGCHYFVLDMDHDIHALAALSAYAASCRKEYPLLARDLQVEVAEMSRRFAGVS